MALVVMGVIVDCRVVAAFEIGFALALGMVIAPDLVMLYTQRGEHDSAGERLREALESGKFADDVHADIREAGTIGVRGVPFFVFNRKYAVSGAQPTEVFEETLQKSFEEWRKENQKSGLNIIEGKVCKPDGECE